jgi:hypothetical protein
MTATFDKEVISNQRFEIERRGSISLVRNILNEGGLDLGEAQIHSHSDGVASSR